MCYLRGGQEPHHKKDLAALEELPLPFVELVEGLEADVGEVVFCRVHQQMLAKHTLVRGRLQTTLRERT